VEAFGRKKAEIRYLQKKLVEALSGLAPRLSGIRRLFAAGEKE
jgi:hypothetical protein